MQTDKSKNINQEPLFPEDDPHPDMREGVRNQDVLGGLWFYHEASSGTPMVALTANLPKYGAVVTFSTDETGEKCVLSARQAKGSKLLFKSCSYEGCKKPIFASKKLYTTDWRPVWTHMEDLLLSKSLYFMTQAQVPSIFMHPAAVELMRQMDDSRITSQGLNFDFKLNNDKDGWSDRARKFEERNQAKNQKLGKRSENDISDDR